MRPLLRFVPGLLVALVLWGCDTNGPTVPASSNTSGEEEYDEGWVIGGSVFVNDADADVDAREPNELGIAQVRVDVLYTPNGGEYDGEEEGIAFSDTTDEDGYYSVEVPYAGYWTVRVTSEGASDVFNPTLFATYDPSSVTERLVLVGGDVVGLTEEDESDATADFGFDLDLRAALEDLTDGAFVTDAKPLRVWRRWMREALGERNCPNQPNWRCRADIEADLAQIFAAPGGDDTFFGNREPFALDTGEDAFAVAEEILSAHPKKGDEEALLIQELLVAQLNFVAGFGSPDPNYDRTLLRYYEVLVGAEERPRKARLAEARLAVSSELAVLQAYNRGGGGGGQVGD